jgi:hypothetical protein
MRSKHGSGTSRRQSGARELRNGRDLRSDRRGRRVSVSARRGYLLPPVPCEGHSMSEAHAGTGFTSEAIDAAVGHRGDTRTDLGVPALTTGRIAELLAPLKTESVCRGCRMQQCCRGPQPCWRCRSRLMVQEPRSGLKESYVDQPGSSVETAALNLWRSGDFDDVWPSVEARPLRRVITSPVRRP